MTKAAPLRVMLVDDHEIVRDGIKAMLDAEDDIVVTAQAGTVREAIDEAHRTRPDVVVMDVRLADGSGIEATREIRAKHPNTKVVMLTSFADDEALFASIMAGASGYVLKQVKGGELVRAIRTVGRGESLLDPVNSIAYGQAPLDLNKAYSTPGIEAKEMFRPIPQLSGTLQATPELSFAGQYIFKWQENRFPESGSRGGRRPGGAGPRATHQQRMVVLSPGAERSAALRSAQCHQ